MITGKHPDYGGDVQHQARILMAPDHKIAQNLFKLKSDPTFRAFLPEFPLLHLRKSKIINLVSAYKDAGLSNLTCYLQDTDESDISKIVHPEKIEQATRFIRRLAVSLQMAFLVLFLQHLPAAESQLVQESWKDQAETQWHQKYENFIGQCCSRNATFQLQCDILQHCLEVLAISRAERIGGSKGYTLLLAAVKTSLRFSFLNGASAYAGFCTRLLIEHASAGPFHRRMKETLFTTPHNGSKKNFALDAQREMDHKVSFFPTLTSFPQRVYIFTVAALEI
jgi:hypothetical protein